ncbi:MAG: glycine C-acetyltransferase [Acidimicrobiia bacterium]|nr:MAG: glycine C-acetyltransferase [Acidimicrobiia bacterium]
MTDKTSYLRDELSALDDQGLYNTITTIDGPQGAWLSVGGRDVLNFCSNNYLGLANDERLVAAAKAALDRYGIGPGAVRTIAGTMTIHDDLEQALTRFKGVEAVISFQSGFAANLAVIPALVGAEDVIISDELNHASIVDGVRLARAGRKIYSHRDVDALSNRLAEARAEGARRILVITDGVFSMDGDIAPLDRIVDTADEHDAIVMVDDAHGEGVLGRSGRGIVDHFDLHGRVDVEVGTMSKAFGAVGGYVAGSKDVVDWLRQRGRPFLFSSALTPPDVAACIAAVEALDASTDLVDRLWSNGKRFKEMMSGAGFDIGISETPITPVMLGDEHLAREVSRLLLEDHDVFAQAIVFPTVAKGKARIRVMISAAHTDADLAVGAEAFTAVGKRLGVVA